MATVFIRLWLMFCPQSRAYSRTIGQLMDVVDSQPEIPCPPDLLRQIHSRLEPRTVPVQAKFGKSWLLLPASIFMGILASVLLWQAFLPINSLKWSIEGVKPSVFKIYRATVDQSRNRMPADSILLDEIVVSRGDRDYQYSDYLLFPSRDFVYRIEALDSMGNETGKSELYVSGDWLMPGQLFGIVTIILCVLGLWMIVDHLLNRKNRSMLRIHQMI